MIRSALTSLRFQIGVTAMCAVIASMCVYASRARRFSERAEFHRGKYVHEVRLRSGPFRCFGHWCEAGEAAEKYHEAMWQKYRDGSGRPWMWLAPDPAPPACACFQGWDDWEDESWDDWESVLQVDENPKGL
jgi:hypothetical protein